MFSRFMKLVAAASLIVSLSACTSSQIYAGDKKSGVYATIPKDWQSLSQLALRNYEAQAKDAASQAKLALVIYESAFSPSKISPEEVLSLKTPDKPIVYLRVRALTGDEMNAVSYNWLRDLIYPITTWLSASSPVNGFELIDDLENVQAGARGVESIFNVRGKDGVLETVDQSALVSTDRSTIYILLIRCPASYYENHLSQLKKISKSFTVKGA